MTDSSQRPPDDGTAEQSAEDAALPMPECGDGWVVERWQLNRLLAEVTPGSQGSDWTWDDEYHDLREHPHFQDLADELSTAPQERPVLVGTDGRLWDGHHRVCALRMLGVDTVLVERKVGAPTGRREA